MNKAPVIKIGRIGSRNEELRAATGGGTVYVTEPFAESLAEKRPDDYLFCLDAAMKMVRVGPAFCCDEERGELKLARVDVDYKEGSGFRLTVASATLSRIPKGWELTSLSVDSGPMPQNPPKELWIKLTPESMATKEDWECVCELANVVPDETSSVKIHVSKAEATPAE